VAAAAAAAAYMSKVTLLLLLLLLLLMLKEVIFLGAVTAVGAVLSGCFHAPERFKTIQLLLLLLSQLLHDAHAAPFTLLAMLVG